MKLLILYISKTGSTKQYAQWPHEEFAGSDLFDITNFDFSKLEEYDLIVAGSPVQGGIFSCDGIPNTTRQLAERLDCFFNGRRRSSSGRKLECEIL